MRTASAPTPTHPPTYLHGVHFKLLKRLVQLPLVALMQPLQTLGRG